MLLWQLFLNGLLSAGAYALVAVGFGLIYRTARFFHFAHGAIFTLGAYVAYLLTARVGLPLMMAVVLAVIVGGSVGALMELAIFRNLRRRRASELTLLLSSIALFTVLQNGISALFGDSTRSLPLGNLTGAIDFLGARVTKVQLIIALVAFLLCGITAAVLWGSKIGNAILAVGADPEMAECSGIDSEKMMLYVFVAGSCLAAIAGVLIGFDTDITPLMGYGAMLTAVVSTIIGGARNPLGWMAGAVVLGVIQHVGVWKIGSEWQDGITFGALLVFLLFRPRGMLGPAVAR